MSHSNRGYYPCSGAPRHSTLRHYEAPWSMAKSRYGSSRVEGSRALCACCATHQRGVTCGFPPHLTLIPSSLFDFFPRSFCPSLPSPVLCSQSGEGTRITSFYLFNSSSPIYTAERGGAAVWDVRLKWEYRTNINE